MIDAPDPATIDWQNLSAEAKDLICDILTGWVDGWGDYGDPVPAEYKPTLTELGFPYLWLYEDYDPETVAGKYPGTRDYEASDAKGMIDLLGEGGKVIATITEEELEAALEEAGLATVQQ